MPNGKMTSEQRSKMFSIYLQAWTLVNDDASVEVPFIVDLTMTSEEWKQEPGFCSRQVEESEHYTFRSGWSDYLRRVPPASFRQTRNFMMVVIAEGQTFDRDDTLHDAKLRGCPITCPVKIHEIGNFERNYHPSKNSANQVSGEKDTRNVIAT